MTFEEYHDKFIEKAASEHYPPAYVDKALEYAKNLMDNNCPVIYDLVHFSKLVGYKPEYIKRAITYPKGYYWHFDIKKKNGKLRHINEPLPNLKDIQKWILDNILYTQPSHKFAKAYIPNKHLKDNARFHTKQPIVITIDIENFFPSIRQESVSEIFERMGYTGLLSSMFAKLTCLDGSLPQGAPTSPYLSNLYLFDFDEKLMKYCVDNKVIYTRYADDLSFSTKDSNYDPEQLIKKVKELLIEKQLKLNEGKTQIMRQYERQIVTGVIVNERVHAPSEYKKNIRQSIYHIRKYGMESHKQHINCKKKNYERYLLGQINHVLSLEPQNSEFLSYRLFMQKQLDPFFKRKLKRLSLNGNVYRECAVDSLNSEWEAYIRSKEGAPILINQKLVSYGRNNSHINSLLFDKEIADQNKDLLHTIIEGIVIYEDGLAYIHYWNKLKQGNNTLIIDTTLQCFGTLFELSVDKAYYPINEITTETLAERVIGGKNLFSDNCSSLIDEFYKTYPNKKEKYDSLKIKIE